MKARTLIVSIVTMIAVTALIVSRNSPSPVAFAQTASAEQPLIEDLVLANRMLVSQELKILDSFGHVSVRSGRNPNHYFISRYVSPGVATPNDIIENDLDSKAVGGDRSDEYQERFIHGEIYKARPDVMAIVHAHTPQFVAFGASSVPMRAVIKDASFIGDGLPLFDISKFNGGRGITVQSGLVNSPELGRALAQSLGNKPAALMLGHGVVIVDSSVRALVSRAYNLRNNADILQQTILLGGKVTYLPEPKAGSTPPPAAAPATGANAPARFDRAWDYWTHFVTQNGLK